MKFLTNIIPLSNCPSPNWAFPCDAPNIPGPSHRLSGRCFMLRSRPPRNVGPSTSCAPPETPSGEGARNGPSTFSPERLCAAKGGTRHGCGYGPCSLRPSEYARSPNRISGRAGRDSDISNRPEEPNTCAWSPKLYDSSDYLWNGNSSGNSTSHKAKTFIETKVTAINCMVLTFN